MDSHFDTIIVGAGPAGSIAAYHLAQAGQNVLIVDKSDFPRDKPCGGGLTPKTVMKIPYDLSEIIEKECYKFSISNKTQHTAAIQSKQVIASMSQRINLDHFMLKKAKKAGAIFQAEQIKEISQRQNKVSITTKSGQTYTANWLIAADGAKSTVRRLVHPKETCFQAFAIEGNVLNEKAQQTDTVELDFFEVPWGYGWIFPKGDHVNVGIGTFNRKIKISKSDLYHYCQKKLGHTNLDNIKGYPLAIGPDNGKRRIGRIIFVGDAAGSVERMLGEGIHNAVVTGTAAAKAVISATSPFMVGLKYFMNISPHRAELRACLHLYSLFYRFKDIGYNLISKPKSLESIKDGFIKGKTVDQIVRKHLFGKY